jgi:predicted Kef-type K+ transport protein
MRGLTQHEFEIVSGGRPAGSGEISDIPYVEPVIVESPLSSYSTGNLNSDISWLQLALVIGAGVTFEVPPVSIALGVLAAGLSVSSASNSEASSAAARANNLAHHPEN